MIHHLLQQFPKLQQRVVFEVVSHACGVANISELITKNRQLTNAQEIIILNNLKEIYNGNPVEYITNNCNFFGNDFFVNKSVLIPRVDTESLVEFVCNLRSSSEKLNILDICTGSGCIAVTIAKFFYNSSVTAIDISYDALEICKKNATKHCVDDRLHTIQMDFLKAPPYELTERHFDIIISNPPYIKSLDILSLDKSVRDYEPHIALDGGSDGLIFYRKLVDYAKTCHNSTFIFEMGWNQASDIQEILRSNDITIFEIIKDLGNNDRGIVFSV